MGTHPIFESDFDCLTENSFEVMADQNNEEAGATFHSRPRAITVDTGMKYDKFLKHLLEELDDKDEFEVCGTTIEEKVNTILELFDQFEEEFDEDELAQAKKKVIYRFAPIETLIRN